MHHADAIAERKRLLLVVRDEQRGDAGGLEDRAHVLRQPLAQVDVEAGERLVEQQQLRPRRQRACQRDALLLAARQLVRGRCAVCAKPDQIEQLVHARVGLGALDPAQTEGDVGRHAEVREQA